MTGAEKRDAHRVWEKQALSRLKLGNGLKFGCAGGALAGLKPPHRPEAPGDPPAAAERCALMCVELIICMSIDLSLPASARNRFSHTPRSAQRTKRLYRHPPDDGLVEAKIATFDGFWQFQTLDTGLSCSQPVTLARRAPKMPNLLSSRRISSVGFARTHDNPRLHAGAGSGGGRSSAISRRMSSNKSLGMATSAIWNAT